MTDGIAHGQDCTVSLLHSVTICNKKDGNNLKSSCCCCRALALPQSVISSIRTLPRAFTQHKHGHAEPVSAKSVWPESWPRNGRLPKIPATPDDPSAIRHLADVWPKGGVSAIPRPGDLCPVICSESPDIEVRDPCPDFVAAATALWLSWGYPALISHDTSTCVQ